MLKSLSEFVYQEAGPDPVDRLDLIRYLAPSIFVAGGYDFNELRELETPDLGSEYISATWPEVPVINPLACITVRPFNPHGYTTFPYELVSQLAGHLRDLLSGAESVPDFDGVIRRAYIKAEHANDWKKAAEHWRRANQPVEASQEPTYESQFEMWETRQALIAAFGRFTGMDMTWFDNLNDTPRLKDARKFAGQGGRRGVEPLFCPFEVMQWLVDAKRKKGRPLQNETAWRLFKQHFPKVYALNAIGDPNAD